MMRLLSISMLIMTVLAACRAEVGLNEAQANRQRCFDGQHALCECDNPGTDAEARYCEQYGL